jgi:spore germination protein KC
MIKPTHKTARKAAILFLVFLLLFTPGCWDRREIQILNINSAIGFDPITIDGQSKILMSVLTIKPSQAAGGSGNTNTAGGPQTQATTSGVVISVTGETIQDAVRNWGQRSSRQLFMGHTVLFVIGEDFAREGIGRVIDFGTRNRDIPERAMITVCEGSARDCLQAQSEFEPLLSTEVYNILNLNKLYTSKTKETNILEVMYDIVTPGIELALPYVKTFTPPEKGSIVRQLPATGEEGSAEESSGEGDQPHKKVLSMAGTVAFRGEKLAGKLDELETQGLLFIKNEVRTGIIPVAFDSTQKNASFRFQNTKTEIKPVIRRNRITFQIKIKGTGELMEGTPKTFDITKKSDIIKMESLINREVEQRCRSAVVKGKELRSDIFGFGDKFHRAHPQAWKRIEDRWAAIFPHVAVDIKAEFTVEHSGLLDKTLKIK